MDTAQLFRDRLLRDLRDIQANADHGFYVHVASHDMRRLCLHLCPMTGPLAGLRIHLSVELPTNWPASPPRVWSSVRNVRHPNILNDGLVCCDLFRETAGGYSGTSTAGYTPGYTLRGVFKQLLSLFSSKVVYDSYFARGRELTDATIVHYVTEAAFVKPFCQPWDLGERRDDRSSRSPYNESEHHLEKLWNADKSEEVVVMSYESEDGSLVKQLTKKSMMRDPQPQVQVQTSSRASRSSKRIFKFETRNPEWEKTYAKIRAFECTECGYGSAGMSQYCPEGIVPSSVLPQVGDDVLAYMVPAATNQLSRLKMDTLQVLCEFLSDETLHAFGAAYRPVSQFLRRTNFFRKRQIRCFYLSTPFQEGVQFNSTPDATSIMGLGIALDPRTNRLSCDTLQDGYLCEEAFQKCGVRRSVRKKDFGFFLPLALNQRHFQQIKPRIIECLKTLSAEVALGDPRRRSDSTGGGHAGPSSRTTRAATARLGAAPGYVRGTTPAVSARTAAQAEVDSVNVLYKFLNDVINNYMQTCEAILDAPPAALRRPRNEGSISSRGEPDDTSNLTLNHAAERFLPLYWQIIHLLISLCRENPLILKAAHDRVRQFIDYPDKRGKEFEPDLGELVVVGALVFACQDEGLLPLQETSDIGPERHGRQRNIPSTQPSRRYDLRHPHSQPPPAAGSSSSRAARDPIIRWTDHFAGPLIQEAMTRGVKQTLVACPDLQYFETGASEYRMARTFQHCRNPFRLIALQVSMLAVFSFYETTPRQNAMAHPAQSHLDRQFGNPPSEASNTLTEEIKAVFRLSNWGEFFTKVQYENGRAWSAEELSAGLRQCMLLSEERGYHINQGKFGDSRHRLTGLRDKREREWKRDHQKRLRGLR